MAKRFGLRRKQKKTRRLAVILFITVLIGSVAGWQLIDFQPLVQKTREIFSSGSHFEFSDGIIRGTLYDRNYRELAVSLERVSVFARSRELESAEAAVETLAPILDVSSDELLEKLRSDDLRNWLVRDISQQQEEEVRRLELPGIYLHKDNSRYYPHKDVAAHLIGFVQDDIGLAGVEYYYDRLVQKMLAREGTEGFRGGTGQHALLTIDLKVQIILEALVDELKAGRGGAKIGAYAMDAGTGALVAAVQEPSFNPTNYRVYSQDILENLLVSPMLLPPKFRKILQDSAALQNQYEARGQVHPWSVSAHQLSLGGELRLWERIGLLNEPPLDFGNNEGSAGKGMAFFLVPGTGEADYGTTPEFLSPLALLTGMSSLLNGGHMLLPHAVQAVVNAASGQEFFLQPEAEKGGGSAVEAGVSHEITRMLAALRTKNELGGVTVSDVAQASISRRDGFGYIRNEVYFSAVPAKDAELTLLITIQDGSRDVKKKSGGEKVDPEVALEKVLPRIAVLQQIGKSVAGVAEPGEREVKNYPIQLKTLRDAVRTSLEEELTGEVDAGVMPELVGLSLRKSLRLLQNKACRIRIYGTGRVIAQNPAPGKSLAGVLECVLKLQQQEDVSLETLEQKLSK